MNPTELLHPQQRRPSKAYLVNELRRAVFSWREKDYPNITDTTRCLLKFWFTEDHIVNGELFEFWFCQKEFEKYRFKSVKELIFTLSK